MTSYVDPKQFTKSAAFVEQKFVYELPEFTTMEDVIRPDYWKPVSDRIKRLAIVTCIGGADGIDIDLRCIGVGNGYCVMRVIRMAPTDSEFEDEVRAGERRVEYRPGHQWCIIGADNGILKDHFETREDATNGLVTFEIDA